MEASCTVGSFPCQLSQISLTDIPVWDEVWEQTTFRHLCLCGRLFTANSVPSLNEVVGTLNSRIP